MTARLYTPEDYPTIKAWWTGHAWAPIPEKFLPSTGIIVGQAAAAFLYDDPTSQIAAMEFTVTNPHNSPMRSMRAIGALVTAMQALATQRGKSALFTACRQHSLARLFTATGFTTADSNMHHLIKSWD
jgi:hypothetical protein